MKPHRACSAHLWFVTVTMLLGGCGNQPTATPPMPRDQITQVSIINALLLSQYDGVTSVGELKKVGDFGLGTFDHLDGEMIVLDGKVYQAKDDGSVVEVDDKLTTPFAIVTTFDQDGDFPCPAVRSLSELDEELDKLLAAQNAIFALRAELELAEVTLRSVPRQEPPYLPLAEVTKTQKVWKHQNVKGTLIGVYCPTWVGGISVPGYHWHFLSNDHRIGGHVIDLSVRGGTVAYDRCDSWLIQLDGLADSSKNFGKDLSKELQQVERQRGDEKPGEK